MRYFNFIILNFIGFSMLSQVEIKEKIFMSGQDSTDRTITGISYPESLNNAANANSLQSGQLIYNQVSGVNSLQLNLIPATDQYITGMVINFKTISANTGPVSIQLNALSPVALKKNGTEVLDSFDLAADQMVTAIFDGINFQVLSKLNRRCPSGFINVNKDFCIEQAERDTAHWFNAVKACGNINARLCTMSEWVYACQNASGLNVFNMIDNFEWVDSAANNPDNAKSMGLNSAGVYGCSSGVTLGWNAVIKFRCCYSK